MTEASRLVLADKIEAISQVGAYIMETREAAEIVAALRAIPLSPGTPVAWRTRGSVDGYWMYFDHEPVTIKSCEVEPLYAAPIQSSGGEAGSSVAWTGDNPNPTPSRSEKGLDTPDTTGTASAMMQGEVAHVGNVANPEIGAVSKPCVDHLSRPSEALQCREGTVSEYLADYEFRTDGGGGYTPNDFEKELIEDAIGGYLALRQPPKSGGTDG